MTQMTQMLDAMNALLTAADQALAAAPDDAARAAVAQHIAQIDASAAAAIMPLVGQIAP